MGTVIEFVVLDSAAKAKHRKDIEAIMSLCDSDFVPPLSSRRGTTQSDLSGKASPGRRNVCFSFYWINTSICPSSGIK